MRRRDLDNTRPRLIQPMWSNKVTVSDLLLKNSPFWTFHPTYCNDVKLYDVTIRNPKGSPNTDGIDPESCSNVHVRGCDVQARNTRG